jgi:hypothetical protein
MSEWLKYITGAIVPMFVWLTARTTLQTKEQDSTSDITNRYLKDLTKRVETLEAENGRLRKIEFKYNTLKTKVDTLESENQNLRRRLVSMEAIEEAHGRINTGHSKKKHGGSTNASDY